MKSKAIFALIVWAALAITGCSPQPASDAGRKIEELSSRVEEQTKLLERKQTEIESLRDSISVLQTSLERIRTHAVHAHTDVRGARAWAVNNGYGSSLVPSIDNVLYDLEAIRTYSSLSDSADGKR